MAHDDAHHPETVSNLGVVWFELPASVSQTVAAEHPAVPWPALASRAWTAPPRPVGPPRPATSARFPWSAVTRPIVPPPGLRRSRAPRLRARQRAGSGLTVLAFLPGERF